MWNALCAHSFCRNDFGNEMWRDSEMRHGEGWRAVVRRNPSAAVSPHLRKNIQVGNQNIDRNTAVHASILNQSNFLIAQDFTSGDQRIFAGMN